MVSYEAEWHNGKKVYVYTNEPRSDYCEVWSVVRKGREPDAGREKSHNKQPEGCKDKPTDSKGKGMEDHSDTRYKNDKEGQLDVHYDDETGKHRTYQIEKRQPESRNVGRSIDLQRILSIRRSSNVLRTIIGQRRKNTTHT